MTGIDPVARSVTTDGNTYEADYIVIAMGADYDMAATPGLEAGGFEYYTVAGAERLRDALADFDGGNVLVSVLGQPFKCPPAPFEGAFLLHEYFKQRGIRESVQLTSTFPMQRPVPVTGEVSQMFRDALAERDIEERSQTLVTSFDPATRTAQLADGGTLPYDLFVGIPIHRAPDPLTASGLAVNGWVPVDQTNLRTQFPQVYAIGDVCTGPRTVPKAGIFAESAALVVADDIAASIAGAERPGPVRRVGHLLRRVRRRARQQGRGRLPQRRGAGGRSATSRRCVRRRQGGVRPAPAGALVRAVSRNRSFSLYIALIAALWILIVVILDGPLLWGTTYAVLQVEVGFRLVEWARRRRHSRVRVEP